MQLEDLGFNSNWSLKNKARDQYIVRVIAEHKNSYFVSDGENDYYSEITGKLMFESNSKIDLPITGDWVLARITDDKSLVLIEEILPRNNLFSRKFPGKKIEAQPIAANLDGIVIVMGLDQNFNPSRLERFLSASFEITENIAIVLTKSDLEIEFESKRKSVQELSKKSIPIFCLNPKESNEFEKLIQFLTPQKTFCLIGSSGVGKSTLINRLLGENIQPTLSVREKDSKGKHSTTNRELFKLPSGALVIDNPGVREFQFWDTKQGLEMEFSEIFKIAENCKFKNCSHENEPDCAVRIAIEEGIISEPRWKNFIKMKKEINYQNSLLDTSLQLETKSKWKKIHKAQKEFYKFNK